MSQKTVLVTGANGFIGNAVAKAFSRAGWRTFGLIRKKEHSADLANEEIHPIIGSPDDISFLAQAGDTVFDVVVSNTEDWSNIAGHYEKVLAMLDDIALRSARAGARPLIMFSSGCKDYGRMAEKDGDAGLVPHTETSPLNPPFFLTARTNVGTTLLAKSGTSYDATVLRPTIVYGHSSSVCGQLFKLAADSKSVLQIQGYSNAIMHSLHVDDCAEAYVALAGHPKREAVAGQAFNISNAKYETAQQVGEALAKSYGLNLEFAEPAEEMALMSLTDFSQWVSSDKLRALTGWTEKKPSFVDGIEQYRLAFEASLRTA